MNVVFDLGGEVLTWQPEAVVAVVFPNPDEAAEKLGIQTIHFTGAADCRAKLVEMRCLSARISRSHSAQAQDSFS